MSDLEKVSSRLANCRVVIEAHEKRHRHGDSYKVIVRIAMPHRGTSHADDEPENECPLVAFAMPGFFSITTMDSWRPWTGGRSFAPLRGPERRFRQAERQG